MVVYSQEYIMETNPLKDEWRNVGLKFCVMQEEFAGTDPVFPPNFEKGGELNLNLLRNKKTRFSKVDDTDKSIPCWERDGCGNWHVDETKNGLYRVFLCKD